MRDRNDGEPEILIVVCAGTDGTGVDDLLVPAARMIQSSVPGAARIVSLDYPATGQILSYDWPGFVRLGSSPKAGVRALIRLLEGDAGDAGDADDAPATGSVVLLGFSQGAAVITETLADPISRRYAPRLPALSEKAHSHVAVAVSIGNPTFCAGEPFNQGTPTPGVSGMFARPLGALAHVQDKVIDLAEHDDISAQHVRSSTMGGHLAYASRGYTTLIADLVTTRLINAPHNPASVRRP